MGAALNPGIKIRWVDEEEVMDILKDYGVKHDISSKSDPSWSHKRIRSVQCDRSEPARRHMQVRVYPGSGKIAGSTQFPWNADELSRLEKAFSLPIVSMAKMVVWFNPQTKLYEFVCGNHRDKKLFEVCPDYVADMIVLNISDEYLVKKIGRADNRRHGVNSSEEEDIYFAVQDVLLMKANQQTVLQEYGITQDQFNRVYQPMKVQERLTALGIKFSTILKADGLLKPLYGMIKATDEDFKSTFDAILAANSSPGITEKQVEQVVKEIKDLSGKKQADAIASAEDKLRGMSRQTKVGAAPRPNAPAPLPDRIHRQLQTVSNWVNGQKRKQHGWQAKQLKESEVFLDNIADYFGMRVETTK